MLTTLDTQPQEWMTGEAELFHTVAACHFTNYEHLEYWVEKLVPKDQNGKFTKWSKARSRQQKNREQFIENCFKYIDEIDFTVNCVSTLESNMTLFAHMFYWQNMDIISQVSDSKNRNCLKFKINDEQTITFPVLRVGHYLWYYHVIKYLVEYKGMTGNLFSDLFCNDEVGPGENKAQGVAFLNYLIKPHYDVSISLPIDYRNSYYERLSDYFCGWTNFVRNKKNSDLIELFEKLENSKQSFFDAVIYAPNIDLTDENGNNITQEIMNQLSNNEV